MSFLKQATTCSVVWMLECAVGNNTSGYMSCLKQETTCADVLKCMLGGPQQIAAFRA